jgi:hypothetical protein
MALTEIPKELSSTPSIVDGGNATAITIDSSERVGINKTSPSEKLHIGASGADDSNAIKIDGTNGSSQTFGFILQADGENARVSFKVGQGNNTPTQKLMIHPDGGICFGTDTAAANALDDYEEGTWTPVPNDLGTSGGTYAGFYTKTGNVLNWGCYILLPTTSDESYIVVSGLPYATRSGTGTTSNTSVGYQNTTIRLQALPNPGTAILYFYTDVASATQPTYSGASGKSIYVGGSYFTA